MDAETRDCLRDLCEAVAILAARTVDLIGTNDAAEVIAKAARLSKRMDTLDLEEMLPDE